MFLDGAKSDAPEELVNYILCKEFGWTYHELMSQPKHFIKSLLAMRSIMNRKS